MDRREMCKEANERESARMLGKITQRICGSDTHGPGCGCEHAAEIVGTLIGVGSKAAATVCDRVAGLRRAAIMGIVEDATDDGEIDNHVARDITRMLERDDDSFLAGPKSV